jgi:modulator of FtsH protease HflC
VKPQRLIIIAVILGVFLAFLTTFTVRFNERAVVTTFGRASESSVYTTPGLRFKLPPPIQEVVKYDARSRFLQSDQETQPTAEGSQVLVTTFLTWRVDDPLKFFRAVSNSGDSERDHYRFAQDILKKRLRTATSAVSKFRLNELIAAEGAGSKIAELESEIFKSLSAGGAGSEMAEYGIKPEAVGIAGMALPQDTTKVVFERMQAARTKIANEAITQGKSLGDTIRSSAESDAKKIESFAEQLATRIRNQGDIEAAQFLGKLNEDPRLAVFLENIKFMRESFGRSTTLVLPTSLPGIELFRPDASKNFKSGQVPESGLDRLQAPATPAGRRSEAGEPKSDQDKSTPIAEGGK